MPKYTDQASGVTIRTDGPLSPAELDAAFAPTPENIQRFGVNEGRKLGIPDQTVLAVLGRESGSDVNAVSPKGASGAMQVMPDTAAMLQKQYGVDMSDPFGRVKGGLLYLRDQFEDFDGNPTLALAAYNAGPGAVREHGGVPPFDETQEYVAAIPTEGWVRQAPAGASAMPLMTDAADPIDRTKRGPVDIPEVPALVASSMGQQRDAEPLLRRLPSQMLDPLAELGLTGMRAMQGSQLPPPSVDRLLTDAAQVGGLAAPFFPVGRLVSAAIQGGAGLAAGLQQAAEKHATTGQSWEDQVQALDAGDALAIGAQAVVGTVLGGVFPGRAARPLSPEGAIARGRQDLATMQARQSAERALPPPRAAEVGTAFRRVNPNAEVDATAWRQALLHHSQYEGKAVPSEIRAVADRLVPEMRTEIRPGSLAGHGFLPSVMPTETVQVPTGRYFARVGDLLDANQALGSMVNTPEARAALPGLGHTAANLRALRNSLSDQLEAALPAQQRTLYQAARGTARDVAQDTAGMRTVEKFLVPDEGRVNGAGLYRDLTGNVEKRIQVLGRDRYTRLVDFARSIQRINTDPEKASSLARILGLGTQLAIGGAVGYGVSPAAGLAAVVVPRALYSLATSRAALRALDGMARAPATSKGFLTAAGRLTLAHTLALKEQHPPPDPQSVDGLLAGR